MDGYLGEEIIKQSKTPFAFYDKHDWAIYFIGRYGQIDGAHHKLWVLDQVARILLGTKVIVKLAKWSNGHQEYRIDLAKPSKKYQKWVKEQLGEYDKENDIYEYNYDTGIAP